MEVDVNEIEEFEQTDLTIELNTGNGQNAVETNNKVVGKLDCVIIDCKAKINLTINSSLGYNILTKSCKEIEYIAPRSKSQEPQENLMGFPKHTKFNLNETLDIIISGQANTDVKLIFRFC